MRHERRPAVGEPVWNDYTVEVVQRIGNDSFTPDNGVLIAKNKNTEGRSCGYNWVIDAHPEDIKMVDFKAGRHVVMRTVADYRQLNDALFHAGTNSGSAYEWKDEANRLHFYVIDVKRSKAGILSYVVGVRSMDGTAGGALGLKPVPAVEPSCWRTPGLWDIYRLAATGAELANAGARCPGRHGAGGGGYRNRPLPRHPSDPAKTAAVKIFR